MHKNIEPGTPAQANTLQIPIAQSLLPHRCRHDPAVSSPEDYPTPAPNADVIRKPLLDGRHLIILNRSSRSLVTRGEPPDTPPDDTGDSSRQQSGPTTEGSGGGMLTTNSSACDCACPGPADPSVNACSAQCAPQWAMCDTVPRTAAADAPAQAPEPLTPTLEAQRKWFSRLVSGSGLAPEVEQMLVDDFATMTDRTRAYLIRQYRNGVE